MPSVVIVAPFTKVTAPIWLKKFVPLVKVPPAVKVIDGELDVWLPNTSCLFNIKFEPLFVILTAPKLDACPDPENNTSGPLSLSVPDKELPPVKFTLAVPSNLNVPAPEKFLEYERLDVIELIV